MNYRYHHIILEVLNDFYNYEPKKTVNVDKSFQQEFKPIGLDVNEMIHEIKSKRKFYFRLIKINEKTISSALVDLKNNQSIASKFTNEKVLFRILDKGRNDYLSNQYITKYSTEIRNNWVTLISITTALVAVIISGISVFIKEDNSQTEIFLLNKLEIKENQILMLNDSLDSLKKESQTLTIENVTLKKSQNSK